MDADPLQLDFDHMTDYPVYTNLDQGQDPSCDCCTGAVWDQAGRQVCQECGAPYEG